MGKRETKDTYNASKALADQNQQNFATARTANDTATTSAKTQADTSRAEVGDLYKGLIGSNPYSVAGSANYNAVDTSGLKDVGTRFKGFSETGGFTPEQEGEVKNEANKLSEIGNTGGIDAESMNRFRGLGVYDEMAKTGGYSDKDVANMRIRGLSPIGAYAQNTQNELDRRKAVQGGYGPGFDAASRTLRRDTARGIADTSLNNELTIKDKINSGRMAGANAASAAEGNLQGLRTGNMLQGSAAAGQMKLALQDTINKYKMQGLSGEEATQRAIADIESANSAGAMNASMFNIQNQEQVDLANQDNTYRGISGLTGLSGLDNENYNSSLDRGINLLGNQANTNLGYLQNRSELATSGGSVGNSLIKGASSVAGALLPFLRPGKNNNPQTPAAGGSAAGSTPVYQTPPGWDFANVNDGNPNPNVTTEEEYSYPGFPGFGRRVY